MMTISEFLYEYKRIVTLMYTFTKEDLDEFWKQVHIVAKNFRIFKTEETLNPYSDICLRKQLDRFFLIG